jgi:hypothetical protein
MDLLTISGLFPVVFSITGFEVDMIGVLCVEKQRLLQP